MKTKIILACLAMIPWLNLAPATDIYHKSSIPRYFTEWAKSEDGKLSVSFAASKTTFTTNEIIFLHCAIINNGDNTITVLRPFGDTFYTHAYGISILGPDGLIHYSGPMKAYVLGALAFIELRPGMVAEDQVELPPNIFPGLGREGLCIISNDYLSDGYTMRPAPDNFWKGKIKTRPVIILIKGETVDKPAQAMH